MNPRTIADIYADIRLLGGIAGKGLGAESLIRAFRAALSDIAKKVKRLGRKRPRVYCEAWPNPRISSPPWVAEMVDICGGEMIVPAGEKVSDAQVAEARPDIIVLAWAATGEKSDPGQSYKVAAWKDVPAIRNRRVYAIGDEFLNTPGPPLIRGALELFKILHSPSTGTTKRKITQRRGVRGNSQRRKVGINTECTEVGH
jgi:iron complex transport system substrate-binding protein